MRTLARKQKAPRQRRGFGLIRPSAAEPAVGRIDEEPKPYLATTASTRFAHDFSRIPVHSNVRGNVQAKLTVNTPGDIYEQEADRIAEKVMRMARPQLQRACADTGECLADRAG